MKYSTILWLIFAVLLIALSLFNKKIHKNFKAIIILIMIIALIGPAILPRQIFGKWNSIAELKDKNIDKIILQPSAPEWEVNLTDSTKIIYNKNEIDSIIYFLQRAEVYFPMHPTRIWETRITFVTSDNDSLKIEINKIDNNGTVIYTPTNEWRKDKIGDFLEKITSYKKPVFGDSINNSVNEYF